MKSASMGYEGGFVFWGYESAVLLVLLYHRNLYSGREYGLANSTVLWSIIKSKFQTTHHCTNRLNSLFCLRLYRLPFKEFGYGLEYAHYKYSYFNILPLPL